MTYTRPKSLGRLWYQQTCSCWRWWWAGLTRWWGSCLMGGLERRGCWITCWALWIRAGVCGCEGLGVCAWRAGSCGKGFVVLDGLIFTGFFRISWSASSGGYAVSQWSSLSQYLTLGSNSIWHFTLISSTSSLSILTSLNSTVRLGLLFSKHASIVWIVD